MTVHELGPADGEGGDSTFHDGPLTIRIGPRFETCLIQLFGELDSGTCPSLERELRRIEHTDANTIVLDLGGLDFLDSAGIRLLLDAVGRSRFDGDRLRLLRPSERAASLLTLMGLEDSLPYLD